MNWLIGSSTAINADANDGVNILRFDIGSELASGVLGQARSRYTGCGSGGVYSWYLNEIDVTFDDGANFSYGTAVPTFSQYDFYSVALHEMGHAHQLAHVIDNTKLMHYSLSNGARKRTISAAEITGASYMTTLSSTSACDKTAMATYTCSPVVTLSASSTAISETNGSSKLTASINGVNYSDVIVNFTLTGTATAGSDYTLSTTITIPAGSTSAFVTLASVGDTRDENNETVIVNISSVTNGTESGTQVQTITITDDDPAPSVTLSTGAASVNETAGTTTVTATLSAISNLDITVNLSLTGTATITTDYTLPTSILIPAGSLSAFATLTAAGDNIDESDETVIIDVATVTNATESGTQQKTVTIADDEVAPSVTLSRGAAAISETGGITTVTATLSAISSLDVTVTLATSGSATPVTDFTLAFTILIPAGSLSASINFVAVSDSRDENDEIRYIDIASATNGTENGFQQIVITITDDDPAPSVTLSSGLTSIPETAGSTMLTATLSAISNLDISVNLSLSGTAVVNTDYTIPSSIIVPAGNLSASITLTSVSDATDENDETVIADISTVTNGTEATAQQKTITITDDDNGPTVTLSKGASPVSENGGVSGFTATLSAVSALLVTVGITYGGPAIYNVDYTVSSFSITIPPGSLSGSVVMTAVNDTKYEGLEWTTWYITNVTNGTESGEQTQTISITDDEPVPTVILSAANSSISETAGSTTITATLSGESALITTVNLALSGTAGSGTDYTLPASITIPAGSFTASLTLASVSDLLYENDETVIADISSVINAAESGVQQQTISISDDDTAPSVILSLDTDSITESGIAVLTASLSAVSGLDVTVQFTLGGTAAPTDYTSLQTVIIPAGSIAGSIAIPALNDAVDENDESVIITIESVTNASVSGTSQMLTIVDDDAAPVVILGVSKDSIPENGGAAIITASLSAVSSLDATINLDFLGTAGATDYTYNTAYISIPAGSMSGSIDLPALNDAIHENDESVIISIGSVTNATASGSTQLLTIVDDDDAPVVILSVSKDSIPENGGTAVITASLSEVSGLDVTVNLAFVGTAGATDYTYDAVNITIPAGSTSGFININTTDDQLNETDETIDINISSVLNSTSSGIQKQTVIITDDETSEMNVYEGGGSVLNGGSYSFGQAVNGSSVTRTFKIKNRGNYPVSLTGNDLITITGTNSGEFILSATATSSTIEGGDSTSFTITYIPACGMDKSALVSIANDGEQNSPFKFSITGTSFENTAPVPDAAALTDINAACEITVSAPFATDNCDGVITATTSDPVSYNQQGTFIITWKYTDVAGNSITQLQKITIADIISPEIICPADIVVNNGPAAVNYIAPVGSDNCIAPSTILLSGLGSGSVFPEGITTETYKVSDNGGNSATCSFTVKVNKLVTGIENEFSSGASVYPNPSSGIINVSLKSILKQMVVMDDKGAIVKVISNQSSVSVIDLSELAEGFYFIQFTTEAGIAYKKISILK